MASRCFWPPESRWGSRCSRPVSPTSASASSTRRRIVCAVQSEVLRAEGDVVFDRSWRRSGRRGAGRPSRPRTAARSARSSSRCRCRRPSPCPTCGSSSPLTSRASGGLARSVGAEDGDHLARAQARSSSSLSARRPSRRGAVGEAHIGEADHQAALSFEQQRGPPSRRPSHGIAVAPQRARIDASRRAP